MAQSGRRTILHGWSERLLSGEEPRGLRGQFLRLLRVFYFAYRDFLRSLCWERAGSLAFATILSLIPLTVLFLSFIGVFWREEKLKSFVETKLLFYLVPDAHLRESLWNILNQDIQITAFQFQAGVNILALLGLMVASVALLVTAEHVFGRIWNVSAPRSYLQKLRIFWIILTTSPVAIGVSLYFEQVVTSGVLGSLRERYWLLGALYSFFLPALITFAAFTIMNLLLPNTRVRLAPAMLGALVTAALWEAAKKGFYLYVAESQNLSRFYGSLGIIPAFLLWIYVTWVIILFGAEVARVAQELPQFTRRSRGRAGPPPPASPFLAVYLLERVYQAFEAGAPLLTLAEIGAALRLNEEVLEPVAQRLVEGGFLVESGVKSVRYAPARAPGLVRVREVVESLAEGILRLDDLTPWADEREESRRVLHLFRGARSAFFESLGERTLADVLLRSNIQNN